MDWLSSLVDFITVDRLASIARAGFVIVAITLLARFVRKRLARTKKLPAQLAMLIRTILTLVLTVIAVVWVLNELGFALGPLLGAAGILTVAVGFAAQTSVSNVISGFFLMAERPFSVGDLIRIGETQGTVLAITLMSVKVRTFDNLMVRIPNETVLKSEVTNLTQFPIRRADLKVGVAYKENLANVRKVLAEVADQNPLCLTEPEPLILFLGFGDSSLDFQFSVWGARENYLKLKNSIGEEVKVAFDEHGIEIPFPHRTLYTGSVTDPMPVKLVSSVTTKEADDA